MPKYISGSKDERIEMPLGEPITLVITETELKESHRGNEMICVRLENDQYSGFIKEFLVFTPAAYFKIDMFLEAIGMKPKEDEMVDVDHKALLGKKLRAVLMREDVGDKKYIRIKKYLAPDESTLPSEQDEIPF
jgi:hypothetical protein